MGAMGATEPFMGANGGNGGNGGFVAPMSDHVRSKNVGCPMVFVLFSVIFGGKMLPFFKIFEKNAAKISFPSGIGRYIGIGNF
jgi:hypothetical protein